MPEISQTWRQFSPCDIPLCQPVLTNKSQVFNQTSTGEKEWSFSDNKKDRISFRLLSSKDEKKKKTKEEIFTCLVLQKQRLKKWFINSGVKHLRDGLVQTESDPRDEESWNVFFLFCDPCSSQLYLILWEYLYDIAVFSEVLNNMLSILISLRLIPEVNHFKPMKSGYCIW